jgi:Anti-sigma-K factor rskA/Putative zinc-finger
MKGNEHISPEDLALLALGTLPEGESAAMRVHLAECKECREELAKFSGDVAMIGLSVPRHPLPAGARQRFLDRVSADAYTAKPAAEAPEPEVEKRGKGFVFPLLVMIPWALAAGLAFVAYTQNVKNKDLDRQLIEDSRKVTALSEESAQAKRVLDVLTSPSAQRVLLTAAKTAPQPTGRAIYIAETGSLLFQANDLKLIAEDKTYELWVIPVNGDPIPAGLFRPDATGSASVLLPNIPLGVEAKAFGVTVEKAEGSDTPTAPIVLAGVATATAGQ